MLSSLCILFGAMDNIEAWDLEIGLLGLVGAGSASDDTLQRLEWQECLEFVEPFLRDANLYGCFSYQTMRALESVSVIIACEVRRIRDHCASVGICEAFAGQRDHRRSFRARARVQLIKAIDERHNPWTWTMTPHLDLDHDATFAPVARIQLIYAIETRHGR